MYPDSLEDKLCFFFVCFVYFILCVRVGVHWSDMMKHNKWMPYMCWILLFMPISNQETEKAIRSNEYEIVLRGKNASPLRCPLAIYAEWMKYQKQYYHKKKYADFRNLFFHFFVYPDLGKEKLLSLWKYQFCYSIRSVWTQMESNEFSKDAINLFPTLKMQSVDIPKYWVSLVYFVRKRSN